MKRVLTAVLAAALTAGVAARAQSESGKGRAGLHGPVKTLRIEAAEFERRGAEIVEGRRVPLKVVTYDAGGVKTEQVEYNYDGSVSQRLVYTYDAQGRNVGYEEYTAGMSIPRRHAYVLDGRGLRTEYRIMQPDGSASEKHVYKYDAKGRMVEESLRDHKGALLSRSVYSYDGRGREVSRTRHNADGSVSSVGSVTYDSAGRTAERVRHDGGVLTYRIRYAYDSKGRVVEQETFGSVVETDVPAAEAHPPGRVKYVYREKNQPAEAVVSAPDGSVRERAVFEYDSRGNWVRKTYFSPAAGGEPGEARRAEYRTITYF